MIDRLQMILDEVPKDKDMKKGSIWWRGKEVEWRAYNEQGLFHIVIEQKEVSIDELLKSGDRK